jgi:hypothetical protein
VTNKDTIVFGVDVFPKSPKPGKRERVECLLSARREDILSYCYKHNDGS